MTTASSARRRLSSGEALARRPLRVVVTHDHDLPGRRPRRSSRSPRRWRCAWSRGCSCPNARSLTSLMPSPCQSGAVVRQTGSDEHAFGQRSGEPGRTVPSHRHLRHARTRQGLARVLVGGPRASRSRTPRTTGSSSSRRTTSTSGMAFQLAPDHVAAGVGRPGPAPAGAPRRDGRRPGGGGAGGWRRWGPASAGVARPRRLGVGGPVGPPVLPHPAARPGRRRWRARGEPGTRPRARRTRSPARAGRRLARHRPPPLRRARGRRRLGAGHRAGWPGTATSPPSTTTSEDRSRAAARRGLVAGRRGSTSPSARSAPGRRWRRPAT